MPYKNVPEFFLSFTPGRFSMMRMRNYFISTWRKFFCSSRYYFRNFLSGSFKKSFRTMALENFSITYPHNLRNCTSNCSKYFSCGISWSCFRNCFRNFSSDSFRNFSEISSGISSKTISGFPQECFLGVIYGTPPKVSYGILKRFFFRNVSGDSFRNFPNIFPGILAKLTSEIASEISVQDFF